jgi:methyl-accepting chemotaxis protein
MKLRTIVQILSVTLITVCVVHYIARKDEASFEDEAVLAGLCFMIVTLYGLLEFKIFSPLQNLKKLHLRLGDADVNTLVAEVQKLSQYEGNINEGAKVIRKFRAGELDEDLSSRTDFSENDLLKALNELRIELKSMQETEKERKWVSDGMASFVDILKADYKDEKNFYDKLLSSIVKYMGANQGGFFLVSEDEQEKEKYLGLVSCYAYDRQKFLTKRIEIGQGLVGQAYLEGQTIFLKAVPDRYVSITSGLGQATPNYLMIVPLKVNGVVECIIEIASFNEFKNYQVQFLEKLGESIASAVSNFRVNENTKVLLKETQLYTEQLRAQEEEMRQNMEELTATQEEMARKEKELSRLLEQSTRDQQELKVRIGEIEMLKEENQRESARMMNMQEMYKHDIIEILNQIPAKIFLKDSKGYMVLCNKTVADGYKLPVNKLIGTHDKDHFDLEQVKVWEEQELEIMKEGKKTFVQEERIHNKTRFLKTTKMPFYIQHLNQRGIMGFQFDVTESLDAERVEKALREEVAMLRTTAKAFA